MENGEKDLRTEKRRTVRTAKTATEAVMRGENRATRQALGTASPAEIAERERRVAMLESSIELALRPGKIPARVIRARLKDLRRSIQKRTQELTEDAR